MPRGLEPFRPVPKDEGDNVGREVSIEPSRHVLGYGRGAVSASRQPVGGDRFEDAECIVEFAEVSGEQVGVAGDLRQSLVGVMAEEKTPTDKAVGGHSLL